MRSESVKPWIPVRIARGRQKVAPTSVLTDRFRLAPQLLMRYCAIEEEAGIAVVFKHLILCRPTAVAIHAVARIVAIAT